MLYVQGREITSSEGCRYSYSMITDIVGNYHGGISRQGLDQ